MLGATGDLSSLNVPSCAFCVSCPQLHRPLIRHLIVRECVAAQLSSRFESLVLLICFANEACPYVKVTGAPPGRTT